MSLRLQLFKGCLLLAGLTLLYNEFLIYYVTLYSCHYPKLPGKSDAVTLDTMILADTHLLGSRNGHWFDKLRREWQMYRSFQTANTLFSPEAVFFLGDIFDEGKWAPPEEFKYYLQRFNELFYVKNGTKRYALAGNHDMGFHYAVTPYLLERFQKAYKSKSVKRVKLKGMDFVFINSMALHQDGCFLCKDAEARLDKLSAKLECAEGSTCVNPILMTHFPLFRESDEMCDELDEASSVEKFSRFKEKWEVLSNASTHLLLDKVKPRGVFTGHTHNGCTTDHGSGLIEWTVSSFSWRNRKNPAFLLARFSNTSIAVSKCILPDEDTVINLYLVLLATVILALLRYPFYHFYINFVRARRKTM